jgi:hypothetical protein
MKALISTTEVFTWTWVTSWKKEEDEWVPDTTDLIENCQRVAQVEPDDKVFEVHSSLIWVDCPDNCVEDQWYYKNGQVQPKPQNALKPTP